jgi:hypothetical protein
LPLYEVVWKDRFVEKMAIKHGVTTAEVEEALFSGPHIRFAEKGRVKDENLYVAYGQTAGADTWLSFSSASAGSQRCPSLPGI